MYVKIGVCSLNSVIVNKYFILFILWTLALLHGTSYFFVAVIKHQDRKQLMEGRVYFS